MGEYTIQSNDTIESIASIYNLLPETLIGVNPNLNSPQVGQTIKIPPLNGIVVNAPSGSTWKDLAQSYGIRSDLLFELNGCTPNPQLVFIPGTNHSSQTTNQNQNNYNEFSYYPLLNNGEIVLNYGWQNNLDTQSTFFHGGVDILGSIGDSVIAIDDGIVVFSGIQDNYGNLIIINHNNGKQSRYAHLQSINVQVGENIPGGAIIGRVGNTGIRDIDLPHLHFEIRIYSPLGWVAQDPLLYLVSNDQ